MAKKGSLSRRGLSKGKKSRVMKSLMGGFRRGGGPNEDLLAAQERLNNAQTDDERDAANQAINKAKLAIAEQKLADAQTVLDSAAKEDQKSAAGAVVSAADEVLALNPDHPDALSKKRAANDIMNPPVAVQPTDESPEPLIGGRRKSKRRKTRRRKTRR